MIINLNLEGDGAWPDLKEVTAQGRLKEAQRIHISGLPWGTLMGRPRVAIRIDLEDGTIVIAQTTLRLFLAVADALRAKYGDEVISDGA